MNLTRTAITRPVFMLMLMLASVLMGTIAYKSMRQELNPDVTFPTVTVVTSYPGAGPDEVSTLISKKLEDAISGVSNLREVSSTSREGSSVVLANFELGSDVNIALSDVRSRVDSVITELPDGALRPTVLKFDNSSSPVLNLAFKSTSRNSQQLRDLLDNVLKDRFGQIPGVAEADVQGGDIKEFQIQLDKDKLLAYGIGITDVANQVIAASQNIPGGRVVEGIKEYSVRVKAQWESVDDIRNSILTVTDANNPGKRVRVRMTDIATVKETIEERTNYARLDGQDTVVVAVQKARDGNSIEITKQADDLIKAIKVEYPDLSVVKTFEAAKQISDSISDLIFTLGFSIFLVSAVVFVFLHNFRGTMIVAIAIPVCIFVSLIVASLVGFTINNMTMLALILAVAVLVDDAIVVLENIYRHLKMGEDPRDAAIHGRGEIGLAALAITMADVVVFLPIAFMGGIVGQFFKPMALTYVFAVLSSMFVSFTITPMLAARWYRKGEDMEHPTGLFARWFEKGFGKLERGYGRVLEWSLNHRWFVFILGNSALVAVFMFIGGGFAGLGAQKASAGFGVGMMPFQVAVALGVITFVVNLFRKYFRPQFILYGILFGLIFPVAGFFGGMFGVWKGEAPFKFEFIPVTDGAQVSVSVKMPPDSSLARTQEAVSKIEKVVMANPNVKYVQSTVGTQSVGGFGGVGNSGSNYASVSATLWDRGALLDKIKKSPERLRWISDTEVAAQLLQSIGHIPSAELKVSATGGSGFGSPIQLSFQSDDHQLLVDTANKIKIGLQNGVIPGVINVDLSTTPGKAELQVHPKRQELAGTGLSVSALGKAIGDMYQGDDTARLRTRGLEYKIRTELQDKDRNDPNVLSKVPVTFVGGVPVFAATVADIVPGESVDKIARRNRTEEIQVTADLLPGFAAGTVQGQIDKWIADKHMMPAGVKTKPLGQADAQNRESGFIMGAFMLGLVLVYMLLASLYDNLLYPMIIQMAQPQAMTGAILGLVLTDLSFNLIGIIGLITLTGLVGKNAILLVDYTNTLRGRGRNRHDALVEAGPTRLRPIAMTTVALIIGTLPIAFAIGRGSEFRQSIGVVIIGGMIVSTLLTLVLIPCSYTIFDDISESFGRRGRRRRGEDENRAFVATPDFTQDSAPIER